MYTRSMALLSGRSTVTRVVWGLRDRVRKVRNQLPVWRKGGMSLPRCFFRKLYFWARGKNITAHQNVRIVGIDNIDINGYLALGDKFVGFLDNRDSSLIRVRGRFNVKGKVSIGKGSRIDIGPKATCEIHQSYITATTRMVVMNGLRIGKGCAISWDVEFLDHDFHHIEYEGRVERDPRIEIGERVWIGSGARILKGTRIANGCVVASGSVVTGVFAEENVLIGGNPAKVIRRDVRWR